jgi:hypothetical protein
MTDRAQPAPLGECRGCYYFTAGDTADFGTCKRFPPATVYNPNALTTEEEVTTQHVMVGSRDWCGEYFAVTDIIADAGSPA